jgi:hypothetical protein
MLSEENNGPFFEAFCRFRAVKSHFLAEFG